MPRLMIVKTGDSFADVIRDHGDFEDFFLAALAPMAEAGRDLTLTVHDARTEGVPPLPAAEDGVLITGSHAMVSEAEPWSEALKPWLVDARDRGVAMLGVCYGHQLMAAAFGGESGYHPDGREVGTLPAAFPAQLTHSQSVLTAPPGAEVLADNDHDPFQALRHGPRQWSVQFHPEFSAAVMRAYLAHQREALDAQGEEPEALLAAVMPTPEAGGLLARFAERLARTPSVA